MEVAAATEVMAAAAGRVNERPTAETVAKVVRQGQAEMVVPADVAEQYVCSTRTLMLATWTPQYLVALGAIRELAAHLAPADLVARAVTEGATYGAASATEITVSGVPKATVHLRQQTGPMARTGYSSFGRWFEGWQTRESPPKYSPRKHRVQGQYRVRKRKPVSGKCHLEPSAREFLDNWADWHFSPSAVRPFDPGNRCSFVWNVSGNPIEAR